MSLAAGQQWTYNAPQGFENSRIVIGAIANCGEQGRIICFSVLNAPYQAEDGSFQPVTLLFIPMTEAAFLETIVAHDGEADPPERFVEALQGWQNDPNGLTFFTVPYETTFDRLMTAQASQMIGRSAA